MSTRSPGVAHGGGEHARGLRVFASLGTSAGAAHLGPPLVAPLCGSGSGVVHALCDHEGVPYHVYMYQQPEPSGRGGSFTFLNLDEDTLKERIVQRWDRGMSVTYDGVTVDSDKATIRVVQTDEPLPSDTTATELLASGRLDVTNVWVTGPAGQAKAALSTAQRGDDIPGFRDATRVMVVHGRNLKARYAMFTFLRALGLRPIEWEQAVQETGTATPHNLEAVRAAMQIGQAVVILLTAEDRAGLLPELAGDDEEDVPLRGQPRQNVILEAGLAMGIDRDRTILVELGKIRRASDFDGLNVVRISDAAGARAALRERLKSAGCALDEAATDWMRPETGGDFDEVAISWEPHAADRTVSSQ